MSYVQAALDRIECEKRLAAQDAAELHWKLISAEVVAPDGRRIPISVDPALVAEEAMRRTNALTNAMREHFEVIFRGEPIPEDGQAAGLPSALTTPDRATPQAAPAPPSRADDRKAIDALLREDARKAPAFATARKAAVLAFCEGNKRSTPESAEVILAWCREYEARRGGMTKPAQSAVDWLDANDVTDYEWSAIGHYERARGMK